MPTVTTGRRTSFQDRSHVRHNIDEMLDFLTPMDAPFLSYLGYTSSMEGPLAGANTLKFPCIQQRHVWLNDDLIPNTSTLALAYTAASGTLDLPNGETEFFDVDDILMVGETYFIVTSVDHGTNKVSVTALAEGAGDQNQPAGSKVVILGNARTEGTAASVITARSTDFGETENFTQIFMDKIDISGSEMSTERYGIQGQDPYQYQLSKKFKELVRKLEYAAIYNVRNTTYPSNNSTARRMGGLAYYVRDNPNAVVHDAAGADLDETRLLNLLEEIWNRGGMPDTIWVGSRQKQALNALLVPYVRTQRTERTLGIIVGQYESDYGSLNVVLNRYLKPSDLIVTTSEYLGIGPLEGNGNSRAFFTEELPKDGDYVRTMIIGEYTMEVRNANKAFGWMKNLSTS